MKSYFDELQLYLDKGMAFHSALNLYEWDMETQAPKMCQENTSKVIGILSDGYFRYYINVEVEKIIKKLENKKYYEKMNCMEQGIIKELKKMQNQLGNIPLEEYKKFSELCATASNVWARSKEKNEYALFAPTLEMMIEYKKKFMKYRGIKGKNVYSNLLYDYEPGFGEEELDLFFEKIKTEIIPLVKTIIEKHSVLNQKYEQNQSKTNKIPREFQYEIEKQRKFCRYLASYIGFDSNKGVISESAHPFTTSLHNHDVRITNHFNEKYPESAIFSVIHETGHALYEMNIKDEYSQTLLGEGTSMGMHESQSRFWENMIGKKEAFWKPLYPKLQETFPAAFNHISLNEFIKEINQVHAGFIRTEADELTYSLHILIRYEIEKEIFHNEKISMEQLEKMWNEKYQEYLGILPKNASEGILQDIHWACGDFGYFPSYAIGSAIAAQIYVHIKNVMPVEEYLESGNLLPIREYLKEHIHQYGKLKTTKELLMEMMGEEFNPNYYIDYLKEKYSELYL